MTISVSGRTLWLRRVTIGAVILVPLAFAGLFVGALSQADRSLDRIPAAIVNNDTLVYSTAQDGTRSPVFAGRQLVTELTGDKKGVDWIVTNEADAKKSLAAGSVYAVLTIPKDFSPSILSLSTPEPKRADLAITTDDAHSYLSGAVAQSVGEGMAATFGNAITAQYISGIYSSMGDLGASLSTAADGAGSLSTGASELSDGLSTLAGGVASAQDGASSFAGAVAQYTGGVDSLSAGLVKLQSGATRLGGVSQGVASFAGSVSGLAQALAAANAELQADPSDSAALAKVQAISSQLNAAAAAGTSLSTQTGVAVGGIRSGIAKSASGAAKLSTGSSALRGGANSVASGMSSLTAGAADASTGAGALSSGATSLADGLSAGVAQLPVTDKDAAAANAQIAADPVGVTVTRDNKLAGIGQGIATFFVPLGLWIGALAVFLVLRPLSRRVLGSTAGNGRLVLHTLTRAAAITAGQALLLVALLHLVVGVSWAALPATLGFSLLMAFAFTAFHHLLTAGLGRAGLVVSLFVLAVQVTATGGLYPVQLLAAPFQWLSPWLPLSYGVSGMQGIITGGTAGPIVGAALTLLLFGAASVLLSVLAVRRTRHARALGLVPSPLPAR